MSKTELTTSKDLPLFPRFEKLDLKHKEWLQSLSIKFPSSDFNFAGLFTWDVDEAVTLSNLNGNLVICSVDYLTREKFYSFIGSKQIDKTIKTLINYAKKEGHSPVLRLIPESVIKQIEQTDVHQISEDRDNHDYIYSVSDLANFRGGKFMKKRNMLHKFEHKYGPLIKEKELNLKNKTVREDIEKVMLRWQSSRGRTDKNVKDESKAIKKALDNHSVLDMKALGIYYDKDLIAFILFEILPKKMAIGHFERADTNFEGLFIYLKHILAKYLAEMGIEFINTEQDLGIEGLRKSKESFHPTSYIKKYTVEEVVLR